MTAVDNSLNDAQHYDNRINEFLPDCDLHALLYGGEEVFETFDRMGLRDELLRGIYSYGLNKPSGIQQRGIVPFIKGRDCIQQALSGFERTATFCSGILQRIDYETIKCQALVLVPTPQHAQQIGKVMKDLGDYLPVKVYTCGVCKETINGLRAIEEGVHVVVGTPHHIWSLIDLGLSTDIIKMFVLEEADGLLSGCSRNEIYDIFQLLPPKIQVGVFLDKLSPVGLNFTRKFMNHPIRIFFKPNEIPIEFRKHYYVNVGKEKYKFDILCNHFETLAIIQSVISVNTRRKVDWLTNKMRSEGRIVSAIHGDMEHNDREKIMREFRSGTSRMLITTDLIASDFYSRRWFLVINFDLPSNPENFFRLPWRSGRIGNKGRVINLVTRNDVNMLAHIENWCSCVIMQELSTNLSTNLSEFL